MLLSTAPSVLRLGLFSPLNRLDPFDSLCSMRGKVKVDRIPRHLLLVKMGCTLEQTFTVRRREVYNKAPQPPPPRQQTTLLMGLLIPTFQILRACRIFMPCRQCIHRLWELGIMVLFASLVFLPTHRHRCSAAHQATIIPKRTQLQHHHSGHRRIPLAVS